jgi:P27 family predicted phage terminase small subunit
VRESWITFWRSPLAEHVIDTDATALRRLFRMYEQRERYLEQANEETLSLGSTGQIVLHPLVKEVDALDAKILALEDRFGLSPMARLKLQVTLGDASKSLEEVNAALAPAKRAADAEPEDPRRAVQ